MNEDVWEDEFDFADEEEALAAREDKLASLSDFCALSILPINFTKSQMNLFSLYFIAGLSPLN